MKYAGIEYNDVTNGKGICVSFWAQGCPFHCRGCHNPETWDYEGGLENSEEHLLNTIILAIKANGIKRNLSILGGEPLDKRNRVFIEKLVRRARAEYPNIKIFLWTGYTLENLVSNNETIISNILSKIDVLIDGQFILEKRDITLDLRGSSNQRILLRGKDF